MTATLSPRLRVDNGIKIWWCGGQLLHIHPQEHLYQASFRPVLVKDTQPFPAVVPQAPEPNESVALYRPKGEVSNGGEFPDELGYRHGEPFLTRRPIGESKPAGAYRPPGARGTLASDAYRRDDEASSGASTPMFKGGKPAQRYVPGHGIPGAGPPGSATPGGGKDADKKKRVRSKRPLKDGAEGKESEANTPAEVAEQVAKVQIGEDAGAVDEAVAKKVRNLTKKVGDSTSSGF
jgi:translation initiation factor 2A